MEVLEFLLSPLIMLMRLLLDGLHGVVRNYGVAIILTSVIVRVLLWPITQMTSRMEQRGKQVQDAMADDLAEAKSTLKGRERFERIDAIYSKHGYHPIKSMASLLPLLLQIPFLLSALFLLTKHPPLMGESFLIIGDLSEPDGLLRLGALSVNLVPVALTAVSVGETFINPNATASARVRFLIVAIVLLALIYPLPAGVCLYWLTSVTFSFFVALYSRRKQAGSEVAAT